jgi:hypothetical protein
MPLDTPLQSPVAPSASPAARRTDLLAFCLSHDEATLVAAEWLGPDGLDPAIGAALVDAGRLSQSQADMLSRGMALYWARCATLFARAPGGWFAPRRTNLLVVADGAPVVPYFEPFAGTSAQLWRSDLDTTADFVAYLLLHMERQSLLRQVRPTLVLNLGYWLLRTDEELQAFAAGARAARRPDAAAYVALAAAQDWLRESFHPALKQPTAAVQEPYLEIAGADLYVPKRRQGELVALCETFERAVHATLAVRSASAASQSSSASNAPSSSPINAALDALCAWLEQAQAHLIIRAPDGRTLWAPDSRDASAVRRALADVPVAALQSLHADFRVVHERTRRFFDALLDPAALPRACAVLETGGGAYVDAERGAVVYELRQPGFDALQVPAPPYHRQLLGARVMHEWGHLAHAGKLLHVPPARQDEIGAARLALGAQFMRVLDKVPARLRDEVECDLRELSRSPAEQPRLLARKTMARVGDYLANLMSSRLIPPAEMQAYVRTNVRHHFDENLGLVSDLARYAYEVHYLALAGVDRSYFYETSRFGAYFIDTGIVSRDDADALFDAAGRVLACWEIDQTKLRVPDRIEVH